MTLGELDRNDMDGAAAVANSHVREFGYLPADVAHYLFMLQDDDRALRLRLAGIRIVEDVAPVL